MKIDIAVISELIYWFNGQRYVAEVREKEEAQRDYDEKIRRLIDPARLWANSKIDELLQQIELFGELDKLVNAIIDLSIRFRILTPYTALYSDPTTGVEEKDPMLLPKTFVLEQNYPNPFNPETKIVFHIPAEAGKQFVTVKIYDLLGRLVRVLFAAEVLPGRYEVIWDGTNELQRPMSSGTFLYILEAGETRLMRKMVLLR